MVARWVGRCPGCEAWNTVVEVAVPVRSAGAAHRSAGDAGRSAVALSTVDARTARPRTTGMAEVDRVLSGGFHLGSVTLIGGEPGVGKSTLLLQLLVAAAGSGPVLLVAAEESAAQIRARAERLGPVPEQLYVLATDDLDEVVATVEALQPALVVVDSIQVVVDRSLSAGGGSIAQVRGCAERLVRLAKDHGPAVILVGHVTKDGDLAGPRVLEHMVDTVVSLEGDRHHALRVLRAVKHRFGSTGDIGLFTMGPEGLVAVEDPGTLLLGDRRPDVAGSVVAPLVSGRRALLVELQVLIGHHQGTMVQRVQGIDSGRLSLVLAVLGTHLGVSFDANGVFASAVGGVRATEPALDLPLALALISAATGVPVPEGVVAFGEVGLTGEVRHVPHAGARLAEAARLGCTDAIVPRSGAPVEADLRQHPVGSVMEATEVLRHLLGAVVAELAELAGKLATVVTACEAVAGRGGG